MSELRKQDLQGIERQLRRIAEALERMSPPSPKDPPKSAYEDGQGLTVI